MLGASRAAVSEMLKRLGSDGLRKRDGGRGSLHDEGRDEPSRSSGVMHHRVVLTDFSVRAQLVPTSMQTNLAMPSTTDMIERMNERFEVLPTTAPHGGLRTRLQGRVVQRNAGLQALSELMSRLDPLRRLALDEHDGDLLHWYYDEGFVPGAALAVLDVQPAAGLVKVALGDGAAAVDHVVAEKAARGLIVRLSPT